MTTVYDVPAEKLIGKVADQLKKDKTFTPPDWANAVKTGIHKQKAPVQEDWWYIRTAALLRKVYVKGPIGIMHLAAEFGGKRDRRVKPYKARTGSRAIIRRALQQLEQAEYIETKKGKGRMITSKGQSFLNKASHDVLKSIIKEHPELGKY
jgi:small subunit ribosomal protein S19e